MISCQGGAPSVNIPKYFLKIALHTDYYGPCSKKAMTFRSRAVVVECSGVAIAQSSRDFPKAMVAVLTPGGIRYQSGVKYVFAPL